MGSNGITQIGSFTVRSVNENSDTEFLETLDGIESIEVVAKEKPEEENDEEMIFSLFYLDEVTCAVKMTFWTRIKLWFWYRKLMIQKRLIVGKFKRSFNKAVKAQARYERRIHHD